MSAQPEQVRVRLDVRGRLGVAYLHAWNLGTASAWKVCANKDGIAIHDSEGSGDSPILRIKWPDSEQGPSDEFEMTIPPDKSNPGRLTARVQMAQPGVSDLLDPGPSRRGNLASQPWTLHHRWPRCLEEGRELPAAALAMWCNGCGRKLEEDPTKGFGLERVLPLPRLNWKEFSVDWFCGCSHGPLPTNGEGTDEHKNGDEGSATNRQLPGYALKPKRGDVLFAPGLVLVHPGELEWDNLVLSDVDGVPRTKLAACGNCDLELGHKTLSAFQLYDHAVTISSQDPPSGKTVDKPLLQRTFVDMFCSILTESLGAGSVKVRFVSPRGAPTGKKEQPPDLFVWAIDQEVETYEGAAFLEEGVLVANLRPFPCVKVMFGRPGEEEKCDADVQTVWLTADLLRAAAGLLETRSEGAGPKQLIISSVPTAAP